MSDTSNIAQVKCICNFFADRITLNNIYICGNDRLTGTVDRKIELYIHINIAIKCQDI